MKLVVIGGNPAGLSCASAVKGSRPDWEVVVYEKGNYISYGSCGLPYYIGGVVEQSNHLITLTKEAMLKDRKVPVHTMHEVTFVDFQAKKLKIMDITNHKEITDTYDYLMIATGGKARIPNELNISHPNIFKVHTIDDSIYIKKVLEEEKLTSGIIIGAGYIGLEMVEAYLSLGVTDLTIIGPVRFCKCTQELIAKELQVHHVKYINSHVIHLQSNSDNQLQVELEDHTKLTAEFVQISAGVVPNTDIFKNTTPSLEMLDNGAIVVDEYMHTNITNVYAAGDCATVYHRLLKKNVYIPLAPAANKQGRVAGNQIAGKSAKGADPFPGVIGSVAFKVLDLYCSRTGLTIEQAKQMGYNAESIQIENNDIAHYYPNNYPIKPGVFQSKINITLVFDVVSHVLLGAEITAPSALGGKKIDVLATAITSGMKIEDVQSLDLAYAPPFAPVWDPILIAANIARKKLK